LRREWDKKGEVLETLALDYRIWWADRLTACLVRERPPVPDEKGVCHSSVDSYGSYKLEMGFYHFSMVFSYGFDGPSHGVDGPTPAVSVSSIPFSRDCHKSYSGVVATR
jgi:hypothetical protein